MGYVPLNGQWKFYPNEMLSTQQAIDKKDIALDVYVPGTWVDKKGQSGLKGYGTYLLEIDHNGDDEPIQFMFTIAPSEAYRAFLNNEELISVGNPTDSKYTNKAEYKSAIVNAMLTEKNIFINSCKQL